MQIHKIPFTKRGYLELEDKLKELQIKRPQIVESLSRAREMGDLSENGLYKAAKFELGQVDRQILNIKRLIKSAAIHIPKDRETVQIGHRVKVANKNKILTYYLVGEYESLPAENKISNKSPIGFAMLGKKKDEEVTIYAPSGKSSYKIVSIE